MGKPAPIMGSAATINEQGRTIRRQDMVIAKLNAERAILVNTLARALDDMNSQLCLTDETIKLMRGVHAKATESVK